MTVMELIIALQENCDGDPRDIELVYESPDGGQYLIGGVNYDTKKNVVIIEEHN